MSKETTPPSIHQVCFDHSRTVINGIKNFKGALRFDSELNSSCLPGRFLNPGEHMLDLGLICLDARSDVIDQLCSTAAASSDPVSAVTCYIKTCQTIVVSLLTDFSFTFAFSNSVLDLFNATRRLNQNSCQDISIALGNGSPTPDQFELYHQSIHLFNRDKMYALNAMRSVCESRQA